MSPTRNGEAKRDRDGAVGGLRYVGDGSGFPDIPARDLTDDELKEISTRLIADAEAYAAGWHLGEGEEGPKVPTLRSLRKQLIDSGLYVEGTVTPIAPAAPETSEG